MSDPSVTTYTSTIKLSSKWLNYFNQFQNTTNDADKQKIINLMNDLYATEKANNIFDGTGLDTTALYDPSNLSADEINKLSVYFAGLINSIHDQLGDDMSAHANENVISFASDANIISSLISFITIPVVGYLGDKFGRRLMYMILSLAMAFYAIPMMLMINSKNIVVLTISLIIGLNLGVQGLFALENVTLAELFGSKNRVTLVSLAKEIAGVIATGFGPVIAAAWVAAMLNSWWPIAIMVIVFSLITFFSAYVSKDTTGRDLNDLDDPM